MKNKIKDFEEYTDRVKEFKVAIQKLQMTGFNERQRSLLVMLESIANLYDDEEMESYYKGAEE